jgi:hypothetical protein
MFDFPTYEGESNEYLKSGIKIRNTARLSCKLTTMILMVLRVADRWQYDAGMQHDGAVGSVKMAALLATCTKEEQRSEGVKPIEIHRRMKVQYGGACLSVQQVYEWTKKGHERH